MPRYWLKIMYPTCIQISHWNFAKMFSTAKARMMRLPYAEESMIMLSSFDKIIPECDRQMDRLTEFLYQYCASVAELMSILKFAQDFI